ncbi:TetR family transcriptional regulator [Paractinoplanes ferrugineus]|uniref:TetR family transcriptional regulator n=1 Tax=Paractinoplanes ferrugineus TaxID=113564 RepID=A0A919J6H7_9ACTN|nr:TetR family transcriptional regulator [Actinoplanes ferrugineus]GIE13903.1 TetR family transcriptional regulator [Actinoplanes ferrugineus]
MTSGVPVARAPRRYDPERKSRIVDAALEVIAEHGVAGTTSRRIAAAADVPLGSITYHFTGQDELLSQAFSRHAERMSPLYEAHFDGVTGLPSFADAVTDLIHGDAGAPPSDWVVAYELYLSALRHPALRNVTEAWMRRSRAVLERFVDPVTARGVDALIEGLVMHLTLSTATFDRADTRAMVGRLIGLPAASA